jgi:hypothetical protein
MRKTYIIVRIITCIIGVVFTYHGLIYLTQQIKCDITYNDFKKSAPTTIATVIDAKHYNHHKDCDDYYITYEYIVDGVTYTKEAHFKNVPVYQGDTITVYYREDDPQNAVTQLSDRVIWYMKSICCVTAGIIFIFSKQRKYY